MAPESGSPAAKPKDLAALDTVIESTETLLNRLHDVVVELHRTSPNTLPQATSSSGDADSTPTQPFSLARDAASLIRAHATKLSLLIINEPFTPSAIVAVMRDLISKPVPSLVSAVEACEPHLYTRFVQRELAWRSMQVLSELKQLVRKIPKDGKVVASDRRQGIGSEGRGSITSTGLLWSACDQVVGLADMGVPGFFVKKTEEWKDTLKDIMEELKEWGDEEPDDEDDGGESGDDAADFGSSYVAADEATANNISTQAMLDDLMNGQAPIPRSDPDRIRPRLESSIKRLRLLILLYQAITKRRFKKLPAPLTGIDQSMSNVPQRLDEAAQILRKLPDRFSDLACAFYDLEPVEIDKAMDQCFFDAFGASEMLSQNWDGGRDEFSDWTAKFQTQIKRE